MTGARGLYPDPATIEYGEKNFFPFLRGRLWRLLQAHMDDAGIHEIHPLVRTEKAVCHVGEVTALQRLIDVSGGHACSTGGSRCARPDLSEYEILTYKGRSAQGSSAENYDSDAPGRTNIRSQMKVDIQGPPFFRSKKRTPREVFGRIDP